MQWPPSAKEWCDEAKRVPCDDLWEEEEEQEEQEQEEEQEEEQE